MTNFLSIALVSVVFLGMCMFTQFVVDCLLAYVCRRLNLSEEARNEL